MTDGLITIEVQLGPHEIPVAYSSPLIVEHGDRVVVPDGGTLAVGYVVGVGSRAEPVDEIVRVLGPLENPDGDPDEWE